MFGREYLRERNQLKVATPSDIDHNLLVVGTLIGRLVILLRMRRLRVLHYLVLDLYLSVSLMPSLQLAPDYLLIEFEFRHEGLHLTYSLHL